MKQHGGTYRLSCWVKKIREGQASYDVTYMWNLKEILQMNTLTKQKLTDLENKPMLLAGRVRGGTVREFGMDMCTLLHLKWIIKKKKIIDKDLLHSTRHSAQYYVTT